MKRIEYCIDPGLADVRADIYLSEQLEEYTRSYLQSLFDQGLVLVQGRIIKKNYKLKENDLIQVCIPDPINLDVLPETIPLSIVYEDSDVLVIDKPKGMVVHPAAGNYQGTLVNALLEHCGDSLSGINGVLRPGIVHRIDKDTSGLLLVAKNDQAHLSLAKQIEEHSCERIYEAIVYGNFKDLTGIVDKPIGRHPIDRKKMAIVKQGGRKAITHYRVIENYQGFSHLELQLETGRTHQIRVHMASIQHPVAGDVIYGPAKAIKSLNGQCLHARQIAFNHPRTGKRMTFRSCLPDYFLMFQNSLQK